MIELLTLCMNVSVCVCVCVSLAESKHLFISGEYKSLVLDY